MAGILDFYGYGGNENELISTKKQLLNRQAEIDSVQDEKIEELENGAGDPKVSLIETTYLDLIQLRNESKLIPGCQYRITDYETKLEENEYARSLDNKFDVIVFAITNNTLSKKAYATQHYGELYFSNCNLDAWELEYDPENLFYPDDGNYITVEDEGAFFELKQVGLVQVDDGMFIGVEGEQDQFSLKRSGFGNIASGGTFATIQFVNYDEGEMVAKKSGKSTIASGGTYCVGSIVTGIGSSKTNVGITKIGTKTSVGGHTYCYLSGIFINTELNVIVEENGTIDVGDYEMIVFNMDGGMVPAQKTGTIEISGVTYFTWQTINGTIVSETTNIGDKCYVYVEGVVLADNSFYIVDYYHIEAGTYVSYEVGDTQGIDIQLFSKTTDVGSDIYFYYSGLYFKGSLLGKEEVFDGQEYSIFNNGSNNTYAIFNESFGSLIYPFDVNTDSITLEFYCGTVISIDNIDNGSECTLFKLDYNGNTFGFVTTNETKNSIAHFIEDITQPIVLNPTNICMILDVNEVNDGQECYIWEKQDGSGDKYLTLTKDSGTTVLPFDDEASASAQTISPIAIGFVTDSIEIDEGTFYMLWSTEDGAGHMVSTDSEVGSYGYVYMNNSIIFEYPMQIKSNKVVYSGGKGTITKMVDEFNNQCPYDFKNIQFKRWKASDTSSGRTGIDGTYMISDVSENWNSLSVLDNTDFIWAFTFSSSKTGGEQEDKSLGGFDIHDNVFESSSLKLLNNVMFGQNNFKNHFGVDCQNNTFGDNFDNNSFGSSCSGNLFGDHCHTISLLNECSNNEFSNNHSNVMLHNGVKLIEINSDEVKNIQVMSGVESLTIDFQANKNYTQVATKNSSNELKIYAPGDLVN